MSTERIYGYWLTLESGRQGYYESHTERKELLGTQVMGETITKVESIPYPANPQFQNLSGCPAFCFSPRYCVGRTSCPKPYACSE